MGAFQSHYKRPKNLQTGLSDLLITDDEDERDAIYEEWEHARSRRDNKQIYESLDYDRWENGLFRKRFIGAPTSQMEEEQNQQTKKMIVRWLFCGLIGIATATFAFIVDISVHKLSGWKFGFLDGLLQDCDDASTWNPACLASPFGLLMAINLGLISIPAFLTVIFAPSAAGSGIPEIKCYLNGVKQRNWLTLKTMITKVIGIVFGVSAGMPIGKEGPMIHTGAIIGGALPQGKSTRLGIDTGFTWFRDDRSKRDFVAAGAAAGVSSAFGSQIGGVLFSIEEGASFWNQALIWRTLFCSATALVMVQFLLSSDPEVDVDSAKVYRRWTLSGHGGTVSFGNFEYFSRISLPLNDTSVNGTIAAQLVSEGVELWSILDLLVFICMGAIGGLLGALWVRCQIAITKFRLRYMKHKALRFFEVLFICALNTTAMFWLATSLGQCMDINTGIHPANEYTRRHYSCTKDPKYVYNDLATLSINPMDTALRYLFHQPSDDHFSLLSCGMFFLVMAFTSCWTYGIGIPSGLFVPSLVTGAAFGRFMGELVNKMTDSYVGSYALMGAAAFLGGVVRMTISLTVILIEATNEVTFGLPILLTLLVAKWVGDYFTKGIYDAHIHLKHVPLLEWEAEKGMERYTCHDVMSTNVKCLPRIVRVSDLILLLRSTTHNGFPVIAQDPGSDSDPYSCPIVHGKFQGLILRSQLITMIQEHCYGCLNDSVVDQPLLTEEHFSRRYPNRTPIEFVEVPEDATELFMDLTMYLNPNPYTAEANMTLPRIYELYRTMGLRHVVVLDEQHYVIGIITRAELTEHKLHELDLEFDQLIDKAKRSKAIKEDETLIQRHETFSMHNDIADTDIDRMTTFEEK